MNLHPLVEKHFPAKVLALKGQDWVFICACETRVQAEFIADTLNRETGLAMKVEGGELQKVAA